MDYKIKEETLTGIADAIRSKTGKTEEILAADFAGNINSIDTSKPEETKEVLLDFSGGDMEVVPTTGNVLSKVTIPQPETLLPENIAEGIDIAGIVGTLTGGGDIKVAMGVITSWGDNTLTIAHNLGVVPDLIIVQAPYDKFTTTNVAVLAFGVSRAFLEAHPEMTFTKVSFKRTSSNYSASYYSSNPTIEDTSGFIRAANENSFALACSYSDHRITPGTVWLAIGGLT